MTIKKVDEILPKYGYTLSSEISPNEAVDYAVGLKVRERSKNA